MDVRASARFAWALCLALPGCNAVLGIDRPSDLVLGDGIGGATDACVPLETSSSSSPDAGSLPHASADAGPPREAVPHAWADWPMPNPGASDVANPQSYLSDTTGIVTDAVTLLQWQRDVADETFSWDEAADHCAALALAGGSFRLPTRIELLSLIDFTATRPTIDVRAFPDAPADKFWSASPFAGAEHSAWLVNFDFGTGFVFSADTQEEHRVRCVADVRREM